MRHLTDSHGRKIRKLRLSLTDKCNMRCHYCMPVDSEFMSESRFLSAIEYSEIVEDLCSFGLEEIRITGGEPLMRKSFTEIVELISKLPLKRIALTTNGVLLDRHFDTLKRFGVNDLNISLDSLNENTFAKITNGNHLKKVVANIEEANKLGFKIKLNVVAMRGVNDNEFPGFVEYASRTGIEVRFLELMRIGFALKKQEAQFISADEIKKSLQASYSFTSTAAAIDSTAYNFVLSNGAKIGFIASESQAFCGQCSRWRLSADGILRACLMKDDGLSIKGMSADKRHEAYQQLLGMKPFMRPKEVAHQMNAIGG
jgi:cyclic pyranopterin phosphate synthase